MAAKYRFGKFVLDTAEQTLFHNESRVHLPVKEFEILALLVENNGKVLTKEEMMSAVWQDTFVEESNLAQYISRLRKTLDADGVQYIKTYPKRGYRFFAEFLDDSEELYLERKVKVKVAEPVYRDARSLTDIARLAVLPFQPLAAGSDGDFLGLGITDALITQLSRTGKIIVRPTRAVKRYADVVQDARTIAQALDVDAVLQGNFQKSDNRLRLTVQLLEGVNAKVLWADSFNTEYDDIFDVQDKIADRITHAFSKQFSDDPAPSSKKQFTDNTEAYSEYLRGRVQFSKRTDDGLANALKHFKRAIEIDPQYALAYTGIADVYQLLPLSDAMCPDVAFPKAKAAALNALALDDSIAEAHLSLGVCLMNYDWNFKGAEVSFKNAIELNPTYAQAHLVYGTMLMRLGRISDAIVEFNQARTLDPLSPSVTTWLAEALSDLGEYDSAIRMHNETIRFSSEYSLAHYYLVLTYLRSGQFSAAENAVENAIKVSDDVSLIRSARTLVKAFMGDTAAARQEIDHLVAKRKSTYVSATNIASGFAGLKDSDNVFKWLDTALADRDSHLTWINSDFEFEYLRDDPRFREILRKVNLPDANEPRKQIGVSAIMPSEAEAPEKNAERSSQGRKWSKFAVAGVAVAAVLGIAGYYLWPVQSAKPIEKNTLIRFTEAPFNDINPTFTRDGQIRFARFIDKKTIVSYIMNSDGTGLREETAIPGLSNGAWSPDGTKVFYHKAASDPNFYLANADGSNERVMPFFPGNSQWSPDSKQFLYQAKARDSIPNNADIYIYTLETGTVTPAVESLFFDSDPSYSPDGKSILYVSDIEGNFEIYTKVLATGETKRLTNNPGHESFPTYSPDGTQIIFNSDREKENNDVYLMNADGGNVRKITDGPGWDAAPPNSWSPDGTQVLLLSDRSGNENIYVMNIEPFVPRRIAANVESDQPLDPSYSPDGDQILYETMNEIRMFDVNSQTNRFVFKTSTAANLTFSPDGTKILFQQRIDENTEICSINTDGSGFVNLTQSPSRDMAPAYSPDGTKIAFAANRAGDLSLFEIYVMNADGSEPRLIFGDRAMSINPAWSPDGKSLVFSNDREEGRIGNFELFSVNVDGGPERRLTNRPHYDVNPSFSPDGTKIAFESNADGNPEIYVMNADGSGLLRLTRDLGKDLFPHWSPDGKKIIFTSNRTGKYVMFQIDLP